MATGFEEATMTPMAEPSADLGMPPTTDAELLGDTDEDDEM
jgi:hypothetical protein